MPVFFLITFLLTACDDIGKPKKLAADVADVAGDVLEIVGTITGNDTVKEMGKDIEHRVEALESQQ